MKVPHKLKFPVRRDETDRVLSLKFRELDALVELAIVDDDGSFTRASGRVVCRRFAFSFHDDFVVDAKLAFGHTRQVRLHNHFPGYVSW